MSDQLLLSVSIVSMAVCILSCGDAWKERDAGWFALGLLGSFINGLAVGMRIALIAGVVR